VSLHTSPAGEQPAGPRRKTGSFGRLWLPLLGGAFPVLLFDQWSKLYISRHFALYQTWPVVPNWFNFTYTANPGAAFSLFADLPHWLRAAFLCASAMLATLIVLALLVRGQDAKLTSWALALILAGAVGNLIDRLRLGAVIDFIDLHYYSHHYPVFNLADCAITVGVGLILLGAIWSKRLVR
jgi:signal peptidase II